MSAKTTAQPTRRTPLSLSGSTSKQQQQVQRPTSNSNDNSSNSRNDNKTTSSLKTEQVATSTNNQKDNKNNNKQQPQQSAADKKSQQQQSAADKKSQQQNIADKKSQQQNTADKKLQQNTKPATSSNATNSGAVKKPERSDEKKTQNGVGNGNSNNSNNSNIGNVKEKHQNGKEAAAADSSKDKKDNRIEKVEKTEKLDVNVEKKEKQEKEKDKKREHEKEKEKETAKEKDIENDKGTPKNEQHEKKPETEARITRENSVEIVENKPQQDEKEIQQHEQKSHSEKKSTVQMNISGSEETSQTPVTPTRKVVEPKMTTPHKPVTPINAAHASPIPNHSSSTSTTTTVKSVVTTSTTTTIDDDDDEDEEMVPLIVEDVSPKKPQPTVVITAAPPSPPKPAATSTPGKFLTFKEIFFSDSPRKAHQRVGSQSSPDRQNCPRTFSQISGRRSIRPGSDAYTASYFQSNMQNRESYRRINTELDVTSNTNTSLNVTVGSEVPNNSSFSFFGRGRKRDRTPPNVVAQSTVDIDLETSPKSPKRPRIDINGFFSVVASPLSMLRSRFSKTSIQSSTPVRLATKLSGAESAEDEGEVQNVSGISIEEELDQAGDDITATEEVTVGNDAAAEQKEASSPNKQDSALQDEAMATDAEDDVGQEELKLQKCGAEKQHENTETLNTEGGIIVVGDVAAKNKKCSVM